MRQQRLGTAKGYGGAKFGHSQIFMQLQALNQDTAEGQANITPGILKRGTEGQYAFMGNV